MSNRNKTMAIILLTVFLDLVGFGIVIPLFTFLARKFHADAFDTGLLMTLYSLAQFLAAPFWGRLSDRWGRRPVILLSMAASSLAHLLFAFAPHLYVLYLARFLAGIFGGNISTAMAAMADISESKDRVKAMGLVGAALGCGFVVGPFIGSLAAGWGETLGSEAPFSGHFPALVAAILCGLNAFAAFFYFPETLVKKSAEDFGELPKLSHKLSHRQRFEVIYAALKEKAIAPFVAIFFFTTMSMSVMELPLFLLVDDRFGWTVQEAGLGFAYVGLVMVFTQGYLIRKLLKIWKEEQLLAIGIIFMLVAFIGIAFAKSPIILSLPITLLALGNSLVNPAVHGLLSLAVGADRQGHIMGVNQSMGSLGRILGPALGGWMYKVGGGLATFFTSALFVFLGLLVFLLVLKKRPKTLPQPS